MPNVQMQIVRRSRDGSEGVMSALDIDLRDHSHYEEQWRRLDRRCEDNEFVRTVGEGSPFRVHLTDDVGGEE